MSKKKTKPAAPTPAKAKPVTDLPVTNLPVSELPIASVWRRLAALVYDAFLLFGLLVTPLFIYTAIVSPKQNLPQDAVAHELPSIAPQPVLFLYTVAIVVGFYVYFWHKSGQTLGMQAWRLRVDNANGGRASWQQCAVRAAVGFVALVALGLGYWWSWADRERRCWHDRASNTRVVVLPKKKS